MRLRSVTSVAWLEAVLRDFDGFLLDHAACERKASATALTFVSHYPDRHELVTEMIDLAREELEHFRMVYQYASARGLQLAADTKDAYVIAMRDLARRGRSDYFLDRLLLAAIIEARGCERFRIVAEEFSSHPHPNPLPPAGEGIGDFYRKLSASEARHRDLFVRLAKVYFPEAEVNRRLEQLLDAEAQIVAGLPFRAALH